MAVFLNLALNGRLGQKREEMTLDIQCKLVAEAKSKHGEKWKLNG